MDFKLTPPIKRVTLDTNVLPADDLIKSVPEGWFEFGRISVSDEEIEGTDIKVSIQPFDFPVGRVEEKLPYGAGPYGGLAYGGVPDKACIMRALAIISNGALSDPSLAVGKKQRAQVRDASILCTHVRDQRDILVSNDERGFMKHGRREKFNQEFGATIVTKDEFLRDFGSHRPRIS